MVKILADTEAPPSKTDWKELFAETGLLETYTSNRGIELRSSATLPCGRTLPPLKQQPTDSFRHWERTAPWRHAFR